MNYLWAEHWQAMGWGVLLVGASNAFNKINRMDMLWHIWHTWASGDRFSLNTYHNWKVLELRWSELTVHSKKGDTQGGS